MRCGLLRRLVVPRSWWFRFGLFVGSRSVLVLVVRRVRCFRLSALLVGVGCWSFAVGVGFGRSACAVVSFHLILGWAPRVGRTSRNLARKCDVRVVS